MYECSWSDRVSINTINIIKVHKPSDISQISYKYYSIYRCSIFKYIFFKSLKFFDCLWSRWFSYSVIQTVHSQYKICEMIMYCHEMSFELNKILNYWILKWLVVNATYTSLMHRTKLIEKNMTLVNQKWNANLNNNWQCEWMWPSEKVFKVNSI